MAVWIGATGDELCLVRVVVDYVAHRGKSSGDFFRFEDTYKELIRGEGARSNNRGWD